MRTPSSSLLAASAVLPLVALVASACPGRDPSIGDPPVVGEIAVAIGAITAPARATPGGEIAVSVDVMNQGRSLRAGDVVLRAREPFSGELALSDDLDADATGTIAGTLTAPTSTGAFTFVLDLATADEVLRETAASAGVVLTCDDGVFCNGAERFAGSACVAGFPPCDDGAACTADTYDEETKRCAHELGADCEACSSSCVPDCTDKECGSDGCGGSCGDCTNGDVCADVLGTCTAPAGLGTCENPIPLLDGARTPRPASSSSPATPPTGATR